MHPRPCGFFFDERFAPSRQGARPVRAKAPLRHRLACGKPRHWSGVVEILVGHAVDIRILQRSAFWWRYVGFRGLHGLAWVLGMVNLGKILALKINNLNYI
jgi:hypothetical protein